MKRTKLIIMVAFGATLASCGNGKSEGDREKERQRIDAINKRNVTPKEFDRLLDSLKKTDPFYDSGRQVSDSLR